MTTKVHLKLIRDPMKSAAYEPAECGASDPGTLMYISAHQSESLESILARNPESDIEICGECQRAWAGFKESEPK